ncbi:glycosyltransferase [Candidatus Pseudothioglobus singularis]|nr:glycosyltransferase [Candidatus Pseudothioglobus singularis]
MNITFLTKYSSNGASSRYRYFLYINDFIQKKSNIEVSNFFNTSYIDNLFNKKKSFYHIFLSYLNRFFVLLNSAKFLVIEYEVFPYLPYFIEAFLLRDKKYVLNIDDNIWDKYKNNIFLKKKYDKLCRNSSGIIVANDYLLKKARKLNHNILKIPTALDTSLYYQTEKENKYKKFSLVWIGSNITYKYIESHSSVFKALASEIDYQLIIIASKSLKNKSIDGVEMIFHDWSSEVEAQILSKSHVGIMPLDDDDFSKGKSAFKLIQYIASGLPLVASNIGENNNVVEDSINGFLVHNEAEWLESIKNLYLNSDLYTRFSKKSFEFSDKYSVDKYKDTYYKFLIESFN